MTKNDHIPILSCQRVARLGMGLAKEVVVVVVYFIFLLVLRHFTLVLHTQYTNFSHEKHHKLKDLELALEIL